MQLAPWFGQKLLAYTHHKTFSDYFSIMYIFSLNNKHFVQVCIYIILYIIWTLVLVSVLFTTKISWHILQIDSSVNIRILLLISI